MFFIIRESYSSSCTPPASTRTCQSPAGTWGRAAPWATGPGPRSTWRSSPRGGRLFCGGGGCEFSWKIHHILIMFFVTEKLFLTPPGWMRSASFPQARSCWGWWTGERSRGRGRRSPGGRSGRSRDGSSHIWKKKFNLLHGAARIFTGTVVSWNKIRT